MMKLLEDFALDVAPITTEAFGKLTWKGPLAHVGPVSDVTPLHGALYQITNCGLYMLYLASLLTSARRIGSVATPKPAHYAAGAIFAAQFDWRYVDNFDQSYSDIEEEDDKSMAIALTLPQYFFMHAKELKSFFSRTPPIEACVFSIRLTEHLLDAADRDRFRAYVEDLIAYLEKVAANPDQSFPERFKFDSDAAYRAAVLPNHGTPLPAEILDPALRNDIDDPLALAEARLRSLDPASNPLLHEPDEIAAKPGETFYQGWTYGT